MTPEQVGLLSDRYRETRERRLAMQREVDAVDKEEKALKNEIIEYLRNEKTGGIAGTNGYMSVLVEKIQPVADDWQALYTHLRETGEFELLHKRLSSDAVSERWEQGVEVPGVGKLTIYDLSVRKL